MLHVRAAPAVCFCLRACAGRATSVSVAGRQRSSTERWPNSAGLDIKAADCCKCFSQPYSDMTTVTRRQRWREMERGRKGNRCTEEGGEGKRERWRDGGGPVLFNAWYVKLAGGEGFESCWPRRLQ